MLKHTEGGGGLQTLTTRVVLYYHIELYYDYIRI